MGNVLATQAWGPGIHLGKPSTEAHPWDPSTGRGSLGLAGQPDWPNSGVPGSVRDLV